MASRKPSTILSAEDVSKPTPLRRKAGTAQAGVTDREEASRTQKPLSNSPSSDVEAQRSGDGAERPSGELLSTLSLFLVAVLWGTNPVCLRYMYRLSEPPSPAALAAIQATGAAVLLSLLSAASAGWKSTREGAESRSRAEQASESAAPAKEGSWLRIEDPWSAGAELGVWTFLANAATISAFQHTPASRGAFLLRLTAVFTPAVSKLAGQSVSGREWAACSVALLGGILISVDGALNSELASGDLALGVGDAVMVFSALLWSAQTVRLGRHARRFDTLALARNQTIGFALLSSLWLLGSFLTLGSGAPQPTGTLLSGATGPLIWAAVLWPALGPWGIGTALQARAQGSVSASRTQIILATDPVWATLLAGLLGAAEQSLGSLGWLGAVCVLAASAVSRH